jgi:tRNA dimethylallyltransferase
MAGRPKNQPASDLQPNETNLALTGPTGVGKSAVALLLAERLGAEIISVDSMQVYRGLDIGTAKPTHAERTRVRHHLIDILDLHESFDAQRFCQLAVEAVRTVMETGRLPLFCGGTGLYFKALLMGLGSMPAANPELRRSLEVRSLDQLLEELRGLDPAACAAIDTANKRRVVRALEVVRLTGLPFAKTRPPWSRVSNETPARSVFGFNLRFLGLRRQPPDLQNRIEQRVDWMFRTGLIEETRNLWVQGLDNNPTARNALGYRQVIEHLKGKTSLVDAQAAVKILTRQFAKRQMTWFRHQLPVTWLDVQPNETAEETAGRVAEWWRQPHPDAPAVRHPSAPWPSQPPLNPGMEIEVSAPRKHTLESAD